VAAIGETRGLAARTADLSEPPLMSQARFPEEETMSTTTPTPEPQQPRKSWPRRHKILTGLASLVVIGAVASIASGSGGGGAPASTATPPAAATAPATVPAVPMPAQTPAEEPATTAPPAPAAPAMTTSQQQAVESAQSYLDMGGFSKAKLIEQLTAKAGEGFPRADAEFAVSYLHPDWNAQAVEAAKSYLDMGGFSRASLLEQLTSSAGEGFTQAQAEYAVNKVGL